MRHLRTAAVVAGSFPFWYVLTRFRSGEINAIDFTVYFDRPRFQTTHRPLFIEASDIPSFPGLLPLIAIYGASDNGRSWLSRETA